MKSSNKEIVWRVLFGLMGAPERKPPTTGKITGKGQMSSPLECFA